jgi:pimeloyl-ACP methyl ester carboxylesterase
MFMPIASLPSTDRLRVATAGSAGRGASGARARGPADEGLEALDETSGYAGLGRSDTFPFPQWRDSDEYRTVFFDAGEGEPIVFVHGLGGNATHFEFLARPLARAHRVVGLDLVGCGWSLKPERSYDIELLRDHLLAFLDRRGIGRATLVGHSLGGAVCLAACLERPGQFDSLALLCAAGVAPLPRWMQAAAPWFLHRSVLAPTLVLGANFIVDHVFVDRARDNPHVRWFRRSAMRDAPTLPNLRAFARVCESLCRDVVSRDYGQRLSSLHLPVLALWGDTDKLTHQPAVLRNLERIRRIRTVILRRCGHMPMIERPRETLEHLERFLQSPP